MAIAGRIEKYIILVLHDEETKRFHQQQRDEGAYIVSFSGSQLSDG